jgi:hypothetical protein
LLSAWTGRFRWGRQLWERDKIQQAQGSFPKLPQG